MRRVFRLELIGRINGLLRLARLVIELDQIQLCLTCEVAERITGFKVLKNIYCREPVGSLHSLSAEFVKLSWSRGLDYRGGATTRAAGHDRQTRGG